MASLDLDNNFARYQIRAYSPGTIQVNELIFNHSIILSPEKIIDNFPAKVFSELNFAVFRPIIDLKPDVVLLGTGETIQFLSTELQNQLLPYQLGIEVMNTSAACRTFNALSAENRNVLAILIIK